jgi:hypothetical protein
MSAGVAGRGDRLQRGVAELDGVVVGERNMLEVDPGALGEICDGAGPLDQLRQPGDVVGLHVRLEHSHDRASLLLGDAHVLVDEVGVRVDDREAGLRLAAEQIRRTRGAVVQKLSEEHACEIIKSSLE